MTAGTLTSSHHLASEDFLERQNYEDEQTFHRSLAQRNAHGVLMSATGAAFRGVCPLTEVCRIPELRTPDLIAQLCSFLPHEGLRHDSGPLLALLTHDPDAVPAAVWDLLMPARTNFWGLVVENPDADDARDRWELPLWVLLLIAGPSDVLERMERGGWDAKRVPHQHAAKPASSWSHPLAALGERAREQQWEAPGVWRPWSEKRKAAFHRVAEGLWERGFSWSDPHLADKLAISTVGERFASKAPGLAAESIARENAWCLARNLEAELPSGSAPFRPRM